MLGYNSFGAMHYAERGCGILRSYLTCAAYESLRYFYNVLDGTNGEVKLTASNSSYLVWTDVEKVVFRLTVLICCYLVELEVSEITFQDFLV